MKPVLAAALCVAKFSPGSLAVRRPIGERPALRPSLGEFGLLASRPRALVVATVLHALVGCASQDLVARRAQIRTANEQSASAMAVENARLRLREWLSFTVDAKYGAAEAATTTEAFVAALNPTSQPGFFQAAQELHGEALSLLDRTAEVNPEERHLILQHKAFLLFALKRPAEARALIEASFALRPSLLSAAVLLNGLGIQDRPRVSELCARARPFEKGDELFELLTLCLRESHALSIEGGLAWASDEDRSWLVAERNRRKAEKAEEQRRTRKERRDLVQMVLSAQEVQLRAEQVRLLGEQNSIQKAALEDQRSRCSRQNIYLFGAGVAALTCAP